MPQACEVLPLRSGGIRTSACTVQGVNGTSVLTVDDPGLGVPAVGVAGCKSDSFRASHVMYSRHVGPRLSPRCILHNTHSHLPSPT